MTETIFDHDRLDVYRLAVEYTAESFRVAQGLAGLHRHARDQWLRAAQSIPLNIAEGNGKRSLNDRARFLDIARGSALECAAIQDVLAATGGLDAESSRGMKRTLHRIVSMLTRMAMKFGGVAETLAGYRVESYLPNLELLSWTGAARFVYSHGKQGQSTDEDRTRTTFAPCSLAAT